MNKIIKNTVLTLMMLALAFSSSSLFAKAIKIATLSPEGTFWMKHMRVGAKEIKEKTKGRVTFKFYPGGVMGNDANVLRKIRIGQLHGASVTSGVLSKSTPDVTLYGLPYLFSSLDDAAGIRKTTDPMLSKEIEKKGFVNFGFAQGGFTYLMSKEPIRSLDDLRNRKSWIPEKSDIGLAVYNYVGVAPISLPLSDVLTGLQTGLIDTITTSPIGALALQWHTHIKYITDQPLNYLTAILIIDKKIFKKISESDQLIVREVMEKVYKKIDEQNKIDNIAARKALINQGVKFIKLSEKDKKEWEKIDDSVINGMLDKYKYNKTLYEAVTKNKKDAPEFH
ncbi:TRAP-type C4-dicarboxylate transport system, periplasmic component [hydrothermal vent metagenome]|uniref:TRAP-type C4-dicarboxylate transport system, periplasmic component n=1 Tax=hydrothermal vent metagenome TaxID=652676 RepID=A0A3B0WLP3_9ZZZZ